MEVAYRIDGVDIKTAFGVMVSESKGLLSRPKPKPAPSAEWKNYHGKIVDLTMKYYDSRQIKLECFIEANGPADFIAKSNAFLNVFGKPELRQMLVSVGGSEPLAYMVHQDESVDIDKAWNENKMIGTFQLSLEEPEPVKRVLKYTRTSAADKTISITFTSAKMLNIYWGDGAHTYDASGTAITLTHDFAANGTFYIVVTGDIDAITSLTSNSIIVWSKL